MVSLGEKKKDIYHKLDGKAEKTRWGISLTVKGRGKQGWKHDPEILCKGKLLGCHQ